MARHEQFSINQLTVGTINGVVMDQLMGRGEAFYLVPDTSSTSLYRDWLLSKGLDPTKMYTSFATAEDAMKSNRGDTLYIFPGDHAVTSAVTWDKNQTNIVGVGGVNQRQQPSTLTTGGVRVKCVTAAIAEILDVTGSYVSMYNVGWFNSAADTGNLYDILVESRNFYAEGCAFRGGNSSTQTGNASAGIPLGIGSGYAARFVNCQIGQSGNATRTTGPGCVKFITGGHGGIDFIDCDFQMRSETTGANPSAFLVQETSLDRITRFIDCTIYNFSENWGALPDYCFNVDQTTTFDILLVRTAVIGFDIISDNAHVKSIDAAPNSAAAEAVAVATS